MKRLLLLAATLLALAGCGAEQESSVDRFQGTEREVAQKVEDLQDAGESGNAEEICSEILARSVVDQLSAAGADCTDEMEKAIEDADDFDLEVREVTVNGNQATVRVQRGDDGPTSTFTFTRENGQWRATSLGS